MNKRLSPAFVELTQDAILKAIWYKPSLRLFLQQHKISEDALAQWHADQSKRDYIQWLWPRLVKDEIGQNAILGMARSLSEMKHFPDLERREDTKERIPTTGTSLTIQSSYDPEVEFLELSTTVASGSSSNRYWKVYGPDISGHYGGMQGTGGLDQVYNSVAKTNAVIMSDVSGHAEMLLSGLTMQFVNLTQNPSLSDGYGVLPGSTAPNPLSTTNSLAGIVAWRGHIIDPTGFYYLGARYYAPDSGEFLSPDPLGHEASMDLYSYCNGDPINNYDPDGRMGLLIPGGFTLMPPVSKNLNLPLAGRSLVGMGGGAILVAGGVATSGTGAGVVVAGFGAYQIGGNFANLESALYGGSGGPTTPLQTAGQITMLASGVQSDSKTWNTVDAFTQLGDAVVPLVFAGQVNSQLESQLTTYSVGQPGTLAGVLTQVSTLSYTLKGAGIQAAAYTDFILSSYGILDSGSKSISGNSLYDNINNLNSLTKNSANTVTTPSGDPLSAQPAKWK